MTGHLLFHYSGGSRPTGLNPSLLSQLLIRAGAPPAPPHVQPAGVQDLLRYCAYQAAMSAILFFAFSDAPSGTYASFRIEFFCISFGPEDFEVLDANHTKR